MNLEDYFKTNLERFKKKARELKDKYPAISEATNIDRDPHITHMIESFAFIGSCIQYKQNKKINEETKSIIYNFPLSEFHISPPIGVLKLLPEEPSFVPKDRTVNCSGQIFKNLYDLCVSKVEIKEVKKENNFIIIRFIKSLNDIERIDLYCEFDILNKIFMNESSINVTVLNREQYKTFAKLSLKSNLDLKQFLHCKESQCIVSLEQLQLKGVGNEFVIEIPCDNLENITVDIDSFNTNCAFVENRYINYTAPFEADVPGDYPIVLEDKDRLITVKKLLDKNKKEVAHIAINNDGWYMSENNGLYSLYVGKANEFLYCEIECYSKVLKDDLDPFFEDFVPARLSWFLTPCKETKYDKIDETTKIIKLAYEESSTKQYLETLIDFVNIKNHQIDIIDINICETVKPVFIGNYVVSQVGEVITIECDTKNYILLKSIAKKMQEKFKHFIDMIFKIGHYKIVINKNFEKPEV